MQAPNASSQSEQQDNNVDAAFLVQTHRAISLIDQAKSLQAIIMKQRDDDAILQKALLLLTTQASLDG
jgi:hypothetical protein